MSGYLGQTPGQGQIQYFTFLATAGQTTFSGIDSNSYVLNYSVGFCDVFLNGRRLTPTSDYTALDGSTIVLQSAASVNDVIFVASASTFDAADWVTNSVNYVYTATAGQTTFTGLDNNSQTLSFVNGTILVSVNGLHLPQSDYTATNGSTVVLNSGVNAGDIVQIFSLRTLNPVNIFTQTESDARYLKLTGGTVSGNITVGNSTVNTQITAGNIALNGSTLLIGNSTSNVVITGTTLTISNSTSNVSFGTGPASINAISTNTFTIGTAAYVIANGNFGLGNSSPATMLVLQGSAGSGKDTTISLINNTASTGRSYYIISGDGGPFRIYDATAAADRMRITANGYIGIGNTAPTYILDVTDPTLTSITAGRCFSPANSAGYSATYFRSEKGNGYGGGLGGWINQGVNSGLVLTTQSAGTLTERLWIDNSGQVGIGNSTPTAKLQVQALGTGTYDKDFIIENANASGQAMLSFTYAGTVKSRIRTDYAGGLVITGMGEQYYGLDSSLSTGINHRFYANSSTATAIILGNGNMGIGTTSPSKKLHIFASGSVSEAPQLLLEGGTNGYGAGITFQSRTSSGGTLVEMARVVADGDSPWNTTASTQDARLSFWTTLDGTAYERMRITSSGYLSVNNGITFPDGVTQTVAAGYPTYTLYTSYSVNTWYQAPVNLVVTVSMRGSYMNGLTVYAGINTSTYYNISEFGDDINSNTKSSGMTFLIKKGSYFYFGSPTPYSYAFENLWLYSFALS